MTKTINLALQGGGAHGAFIWGILDRLVEEKNISIEGISATSAGAMNAAVFSYALTKGGPSTVKEILENFWLHVSDENILGNITSIYEPFFEVFKDMIKPYLPVMHTQTLNPLTLTNPLENPLLLQLVLNFDFITRILSPYQLNPINYNPLRVILEKTVDFSTLKNSPVKLFLCATNIRTGKIKIFRKQDITIDTVLASGCLPFLFQTIVIDNEPYWDGGYMGNPAIYPLIYHCTSRDIVIAHINPIERNHIPRTSNEIFDRLNEITFNSTLMREMRAIAFVTRLINESKIPPDEMKKLHIHGIEAFEIMGKLDVLTKYIPDKKMLMQLKNIGQEITETWLQKNYDKLGVESTIDISSLYL